MPKPSNRRQLETDLQDAQAELAAARARVSDLLSTSEALQARVHELEDVHAATPGVAADGSSAPTPADEEVAAGQGERESQLARRVAELEAARIDEGGIRRDTDEAASRVRELDERVQSLQLQLEAARIREDDLTARTVHADGLLADLGLRLADLGAQADRAEQLAVDLERTREESAFALSVAREDAAAARDELLEVRADLETRLATAQDRLVELEAEHRAAVERAELAEARAEESELRATALEAELIAATDILKSLEQVYAAVRDRVEGADEDPARRSHGAGHDEDDAAAHVEMRSQLEAAVVRVQGLEQELQESVAVLRGQVGDLAERVSGAEATGHPSPDPVAAAPAEPIDVPPAAPVPVQYLSVTDLLALGERELGLGTPVDLAALEAVASAPCAQDDGQERFPGMHVKAAALLAETLHRQPFAHGNDRVALMAVVVFLSMNGYGVDAPEEDLAELTRIVAEGELPLLHIAAALEAASSPLPAGLGDLRMEG